MHSQKQLVMWDGYNNGTGLGSTSYALSGTANPHYSTAEPTEDRDLFFTGGSYYAVRVEQETHPQLTNYLHSEMDNTAVPLADGHLDDEETANGPHDYDATEEKVLQLQMELEHMRENYEQLLLEIQNNDQGASTEVEEIIEEEVRTVKGNRPSVKQEEAIHLESPVARRVVTREVAIQSPLMTTRTMATMASPIDPATKQCFAVNVRPSTKDAGTLCPQPIKREFGCTAVESDAALHEWVEQNMTHHSEVTRKLITTLLRSCYKSRESFVRTLLSVLRKENKTVGVEAKPQQRQQSTSTLPSLQEIPVQEAPKVEAPPPVVLTESQMVEARPLLMNKSSMTSRIHAVHVGVATESILLRSQGSQTLQQVSDITTSGVQTDGPPGLVDRGVHAVLESIQHVSSSFQPEVSKSEHSSEHQAQTESSANPSTVRTTIESRSTTTADKRLLSEAIKEAMEQSSECIRTTHLRSSRPLSPTEVQKLFQSGLGPGSTPFSEFVQTQETSYTSHSPYTKTAQGESCTVSTERRIVDEQSACHMVPSDVNLDELARGDSVVLDSILARSKPVVSSHVIRHYQPSVEVVHHVTDHPSPPLLRPLTPIQISPQTSPSTRVPDVSAFRSPPLKSYEIPIFHASPTFQASDSVARTSIAQSPELKHFWMETIRVPGASSSKEKMPMHREECSTGEHTYFTEHVTSGSSGVHSASHATTASSFGTSESVLTTVHPGPSRTQSASSATRAPSRNHSFNISDEATKACQSLAAQCSSKQTRSLQSSELAKLTKICFELSSSAQEKREQLEDFFAILYEYHPDLLKSVVQSTNEQGDTCLHLAVGHGAWDVVNLILDSGYAEPDRLNRAGYSPVMVASLGAQSSAFAMNPLDRLFYMGDVNLRSNADPQLTPLMLAAQNGSLEVLHLLLKHGALVNMQDMAGNTALMFAIQQGNHAVISSLLSCPDLDLRLCDNRGDDALAIAMRLEDSRVIHMIKCALEANRISEDRRQRPNTRYTCRKDVHEILRDLRSTSLCPSRQKR
ncbi:hypothetical protein CRM22_006033 [Opisthorchis felineus]|uniref:Uncharacterized protein n=1 Tax=Opisthorchis felineus TaxID=147828 RepID=A0A4S2LPR1_OPIFE|nr:hypothetical protein CRM22_006033 [Opisthorchis felineus]